MFSSWMRLNSSFNGACCAAPAGLLGSYRGPPPIAFQRHWPDQSGYLDSSCAEATVMVANVAAIVSTPIRIRTIMGCSPCPGGMLMLKRVVAIFDAVQKVRKSSEKSAGDGDLGDLEGIRLGVKLLVAQGANVVWFASKVAQERTSRVGPLGSFSTDESGVASGRLRLAPNAGFPIDDRSRATHLMRGRPQDLAHQNSGLVLRQPADILHEDRRDRAIV